MESVTVAKFMRLIAPLSPETKLEILSELLKSLKVDFSTKKDNRIELLEEVAGSWSGTESDLAERIISSRTLSDDRLSLD